MVGCRGVLCNFGISFVHTLQSENKETYAGEGGFTAFISGRVIRIYPVMVLTTVFTAVCLWLTVYFFPEGHLASAGWATDAMHTTLVAFFLSVCGLQSGWISDRDHAAVYGASWYLSVLMICNILFYFILRYCKGKRIRENGCFIFLVLFGAYLRINGGLAFPLMYSWCGRGYMGFFMGALVAQLTTKVNADKQKQLLLLESVAAIFLYWVLLKIGCLGNLSVATSLVLSPALLILLTESKIISQISNNSIITYLGNISFGIYLWHQPVIIWLYFFQDLFHWNINYESKYVFFNIILLTVIVAAATFALYERPITRHWKMKLAEYNAINRRM